MITKSKSLFESFKERVIVSVGDYFCCIHIFSAKLLICSQTFVNLKYIQKLEISYELDVRLNFTPMYGGFTDCAKHASAAALIHRQQTLWLFTQTKLSSIYRNKPIVTYTCIGPWWNVKRCLQFKVTVDLQGCLPKNHSYARRLCFNHRKVYIIVKLIKCKIRKNKHF